MTSLEATLATILLMTCVALVLSQILAFRFAVTTHRAMQALIEERDTWRAAQAECHELHTAEAHMRSKA